MGLNYNVLSVLTQEFLKGRKYKDAITIGRQAISLSSSQIKELANKAGTVDFSNSSKYVDDFLKKVLKVEHLGILDVSDYEGASLIHNLNEPLPEKHHQQYDLLIDGGSIEHIFNIPEAMKSYMSLLKAGGELIILTAANNHFGHGFYQLSPEFFYRACSEQNGFKVKKLIIQEHSYPSAELGKSYTSWMIKDPKDYRKRIGLVSARPSLIMMHAVRETIKPLFTDYPVQSDYTRIHREFAASPGSEKKASVKDLAEKNFRKLPKIIKDFILGQVEKIRYSFWNKSAFQKWRPFD